jgi:hypothetical protein
LRALDPLVQNKLTEVVVTWDQILFRVARRKHEAFILKGTSQP